MMEVATPLQNGMGDTNGHHNGYHHNSGGHKESEEERRIRKDRERKAKENETDEERRIRKEKEKSRHKETEEERRIRKEKEKSLAGGEKRKETEDERRIRKEKEKKAKGNETEEERRNRKEKEGKRETEDERKIRKEKERREKEAGGERRKETEEERRVRKEREKKAKENETEEERRIRKEKEKQQKKHETEEERAARKERERKEKKHETEEERAVRKERELSERMVKERRPEVKEEMMELGDDYFAAEEERLNNSNAKKKVKEEDEDDAFVKQENGDSEDDSKQGIIRQEIPCDDSDDDTPLAKRKKPAVKRKVESGDESEDEPLSKKKANVKKRRDSYEDEDDFKPSKKLKNKKPDKKAKATDSPSKKMTKKEKELEAEKQVWKWWEEENALPDGVKWRYLEHKGPMFAPDYDPLPEHVRFWYEGKTLRLTEETEECATFYGKMLDHDYTTKEVFNKNFFKDWRKVMTEKEKDIIRDLSKCDFSEINEHFKKLSEERKSRSKEEKKAEKEQNEAIIVDFGFCTMDGHKEKIGNFRTEPPSLFRGRGEHPKQGMIKRRIMPEDCIINCSKDSEVPLAPKGHKWKKVQHDNTVTWLASWTENIQGQIKYIMLNPSSRLKGEKDWQKYEKARKLKEGIHKIRDDYMEDMKSKEMRVRQRAVALYFIDKLALRAGNEKDEDQADTVGCCSLRVEHITLHEKLEGKEFVVEFDFLGKDSIRYNNAVAVEKKVYKNVKLFMENKKDGDDLFDRLNTSVLNQYLNSLMDGLTAKVFRTYNASFTLQEQLDDMTNPDDNVSAKMLSYNRANRAVAVLCNHQRAVPKTHEKSMDNLHGKIEGKQDAIKEAEKKLKQAKKAVKNNGSEAEKASAEKSKKTLGRLLEQLEKLEIQKTDKDENKTIALGTSKLNYLDPRISVAWCKKHDVPIEKVYNKTQREKFRWAIDMITNQDEEYHF
eukprot:GFUD01044798.1.p1 GENE.GFUD01044798.1~~GFUD01044798.1.p1  ORF type:complete len:950 (-),score=387.86 GFUD01044798.1:592-3441(-)